MKVTAKGQITIVDTNDGRSMSMILTSNHPTTQIYTSGASEEGDDSAGVYTPNYAEDGNWLVITPEVFVSGLSGDQLKECDNVSWKIDRQDGSARDDHNDKYWSYYDAETDDVDIDGRIVRNGKLIIKRNMVERAQMTIECSLLFIDPETGLETEAKSVIQFTKVNNAGDSICAIMYAPYGNTVKVDMDNVENSLDCVTLHCDMWRGSAIDDEDVTHEWYYLNKDGEFKHIRKDSTNAGLFRVASRTVTKGNRTYVVHDELVVGADAIDNFLVIKCEITDDDEGAPTHNKVVMDTITIYDSTDVYSVQVSSDKGDRLSSLRPSTTIRATVWNDGVPCDDDFHYNYVSFDWVMRDSNGAPVAQEDWFEAAKSDINTSDHKSVMKDGSYRDLTVTKSMISGRAVFDCTATIKFNLVSNLRDPENIAPPSFGNHTDRTDMRL